MVVLFDHYLTMAGLQLSDEDGQGLIEYVLTSTGTRSGAIDPLADQLIEA